MIVRMSERKLYSILQWIVPPANVNGVCQHICVYLWLPIPYCNAHTPSAMDTETLIRGSFGLFLTIDNHKGIPSILLSRSRVELAMVQPNTRKMSSSRWFLIPGSKNSPHSTLKKSWATVQQVHHLDKINHCKGERPAKHICA
jgi:hypothetical protein